MATTKYCPDSCDRAKIKKSNDCNDVITFWDCLFGKDRWKDLHRKRGDLCEEAGQIQRMTTQNVLSKPVVLTRTEANKPQKSENQANKTKTIFHREVCSLEIVPTNMLRYVWPWKIKDHKVKHNAGKKKNVQEEMTNQNEPDKYNKKFVRRRVREEHGVVLEENPNNDGLNGRRMQTDSIGRRQEEYTRKMSHSRTNENDLIFPPPNCRSAIRKVPSPTFITAQLTDLSIKIDKLENTIINLSSEKQSHVSEQGEGHKNVRISGKKKIGNTTSKQGRHFNVTKVRCVTRVSNGKHSTKNNKRFSKVDEKTTNVGRNDTQSFINVTNQPKRYTIRRSESNPSLLRIHAPKYSKCHKNNVDACILIHTQKKDVCVHGSYLEIKQNKSWWDQVKNIFSFSFIDKVFYRDTERKNEDNNNHRTTMARNPKNCDNSESSGDNDSFHSFDEYDLGEELNSRFSNNRKSVSYTILNNRSMVMADHDHNKKQEKTAVENTVYKKMDVLDRNGILRGNTSELTDENYHRNISENPVESTENGNKAVENSMKSHSDSFHNMLGEIYLSKKYRFLHESIQRDCCDEPNSYSMNKDRQSNENKHFEMDLLNNKNLRQNRDVLCHSEEENIEMYGVETSKNKSETPKKGVMTFTKTLHSKFKSKNSTTEYQEKLTKTTKSEYSDTFRDSSFLKLFTQDGFYSFFPFSNKELEKKEENNTVFLPNLAGTRIYQVYEFGDLSKITYNIS